MGQNDPRLSCRERGYTKRTAVMFDAGDFSYVYIVYCIYLLFKYLTESKGFPKLQF
ncbi:MAG: DNA-3-methyladenine glycosylase [Arsenophonus sp. ER-EMS1-MAG3]